MGGSEGHREWCMCVRVLGVRNFGLGSYILECMGGRKLLWRFSRRR